MRKKWLITQMVNKMEMKRTWRLNFVLLNASDLNLMNASLYRFEVLDEEPGDDEESSEQKYVFPYPYLLNNIYFINFFYCVILCKLYKCLSVGIFVLILRQFRNSFLSFVFKSTKVCFFFSFFFIFVSLKKAMLSILTWQCMLGTLHIQFEL